MDFFLNKVPMLLMLAIFFTMFVIYIWCTSDDRKHEETAALLLCVLGYADFVFGCIWLWRNPLSDAGSLSTVYLCVLLAVFVAVMFVVALFLTVKILARKSARQINP